MATSGNFEKPITDWLKLRIEWAENSQNTETNKTNLTVIAYLVSSASNGVINSTASKTISLTINGTTYTHTATGLAKLSGNQKKQLFKKTVDVAHNADGSKSCSISCSFGIKVTLGGKYYDTVTASGTANLDKIPRASSIASISGSTIGSSVTVVITPASSTFSHKLYYTAPTQSNLEEIKDITTKDGVTSATFTPLINDCSYLPNATSGTAKITLETYSGTTKLGTVTKTFTLNVPSSVKPTISALTVAEAVAGLGEKFGEKDENGNIKKFVYIQTKSKAAVSITASGSYKSTIKTITTTLTNGSSVLTYNGASFTSAFLSFSGTYTVKTVVTDSRGRTAEASTTITVAAYSPPEITSFTAYRVNEDEEKDDNGTTANGDIAFKVTPVSNKNDCYLKLEYRESGTSKWEIVEQEMQLAPSIYEATKADPITTFKENLSIDKAYELRVTVRDYFATATRTAEVPTARTIFDILADGTGICFGGVASQSGVCQVNMKTLFKGGQINLNAQDETDLNQFTQPNIYVSKNNAASSYKNLPEGFYGTFTLEVMSAGQEGQILQRATLCSKDYPDIRERHYYGGTWGEWKTIFNGSIGRITSASKSVQITTAGIDNNIDGAEIDIDAGTYIVAVAATINSAATGNDRNIQVRLLAKKSDNTTSVISRERVAAVNFAEIRTTAIYTATESVTLICQKSSSTAEQATGNTSITAVRIA